jgi:hypothetical protein
MHQYCVCLQRHSGINQGLAGSHATDYFADLGSTLDLQAVWAVIIKILNVKQLSQGVY